MEKQSIFHFVDSKGILIHLTEEQKKQISSAETIKKMIGNPNIFAYDIYRKSNLIGFAMLRKYSDEGYFLWDYAIDIQYQNMGFGTEVLKYMIEFMKAKFHATELSTTYIWGNDPAKHLYEKVGFIETDVVDEDGIHEVNLIKKI